MVISFDLSIAFHFFLLLIVVKYVVIHWKFDPWLASRGKIQVESATFSLATFTWNKTFFKAKLEYRIIRSLYSLRSILIFLIPLAHFLERQEGTRSNISPSSLPRLRAFYRRKQLNAFYYYAGIKKVKSNERSKFLSFFFFIHPHAISPHDTKKIRSSGGKNRSNKPPRFTLYFSRCA